MSSQDTSSFNLRSRRSLVIGGKVAPHDEYPFFALVNDDCGGSLISPNVVVTAGHCLPKRTLMRNYTHNLDIVRVGMYTRRHEADDDDLEESQVELFVINQAKRHRHFKRYGDDEFRFDYTLIELNGTSTHPVLPIHRDPESWGNYTDHVVTAIGMGFTHADYESKAKYLREVNLTVISNEACKHVKDHEREESYKGRIGSSHLCTFEPHKDTCAYDSGSPLMVLDESSNQHKLVGMVSWGMECAGPVFPAVNSRISVVQDWIDDTVCEWSGHRAPLDFGCFPPPPTAITHKFPFSFPVLGDKDFVLLLLLCLLTMVCSRSYWARRRQSYEELK